MGRGRLGDMAEHQRKPRVDDDSSTDQHDDRAQEASALPIARSLANPRRVRRA